MPCSDEEQDRIGCEFSTILRSAVVECSEVPTSLCCNCRTVIMISALLTGAAHIHHSAGVDEDFAEIARRVHAAFIKEEHPHLDS
ncbi:hypothetical protein GA0061099_103014 [Bradyrhizobium yuanmingense]|uniref:Uncharacterized protein n=1 Tax=Bradyrhizobium yuanmingense TaxID=108015 RepID=A0A1C3XJW1_9BRAD|nr:hypothetical protein [Bradyrhizobium yuanmingense]TWI17765.1 hypothetical protein IQ15_07355 [Bradyrhizobium yuanmingense]SCB52264.1 hypothetical protein GA0061099_103014 [Bradyrhizobium yuanmingense]